MTARISTRFDITLGAFHRVAWSGESVEIGPEAIARMDECHASFVALVDSLVMKDPQALIYGVTTAPGDGATTVLSPEAERLRPTRLWTAASFGDGLPVRVVRGIVLARLANFVDGNAGVRSQVARAVAAMLDEGPLPHIPAEANGGSGEVLALGHLFFELSERLALEPKERMALINGSPCAAALVADAAVAGRGRIDLAERVFALAAETIRVPLEAYSSDLEALWDDEHETAALRSLRLLLAGGAESRQLSQAPVSFRILPRLLGQIRRAQAEAEGAATGALRSVTDNPVYFPPDDRHPLGAICSNGGFHNARATAALDGISFAWADLCQLAQRQSDRLFLHPATAALLAPDEWRLKSVHMVQTGWAEEARALSQPSLLSLGSFGQNDVPAMSFFAWRRASAIGRCLDASLAVLAGVSAQALDAGGRQPPPGLASFLREIREAFPPVDSVRRLGLDFEALADQFAGRVFRVAGEPQLAG